MFIYSKVKIKYKRKDKKKIKIKKTKTKRQSANQATNPKFLLLFLLFSYSEVNSTALFPLPKPFLFILNLLPRRDHPSTCQRCTLIGSLLYLEVSYRLSAVGYYYLRLKLT